MTSQVLLAGEKDAVGEEFCRSHLRDREPYEMCPFRRR